MVGAGDQTPKKEREGFHERVWNKGHSIIHSDYGEV